MALRGHRLLDTATETAFDTLTELVRLVCNVPIALVSLVDAERQWFKAAAGVDLRETPIDTSVCALSIRQRGFFQITDLSSDPRTAGMSLVTAADGIRFYAGVPLIDRAGHALGTLCAIDTAVRPGGLTDVQQGALSLMADHVITLIEARSASMGDEDADRASAARRAREVAARYDVVTRAARLGTFDFAPLSGQLTWDDKCRELFGLPPGAPVSYEGAFLAGLHPDDREAADAAVQAALDSAGSGMFEIEYRTIGIVDRALRHIAARGQAFFENGRPVHFVGTVQDVTDRKQSASRLSETEERLRLANRATNDAIWDWNLRADHVAWNEALERAYGHAPDDVEPTGGWWIAHIHPDDRERIDHSIHAVIDGGGSDWTDSYRFRRADGSYADVRDRGFVLRDASGAPIRMIGAMLDQSEQIAVERRLRDERDRVWDSTNDLMGTAGLDGYMKAINPAWTRSLGWTDEELLGSPFLRFVDPADHAETGDVVRRLGEGQTISSFVDHVLCEDGSARVIDWQAVPDPDGRHFHIVGRDITEQRAAEDALRQAQKMEAVGQLTGGLAHDFNNLLTGMLGNLELLQSRVQRGRTDDLDRFLVAAQGAGRRAASLTQRLLAFSRRQTLDPKPTDVNRLIAGMEEMLRRTVGPSHAIEVVGAAGLWTANIDAGQLENALLNLCINARDAMPESGRIVIETANKWLDDRGARERDLDAGQYLSICVTDTGAGMAPEVVERAFEPFFTTKPIGQGTGLGLSMIYGFARQSGGQVRIYSELGQGTTLCIYLPRHAGAAEQAAGDTPTPSAGGSNGQTVLIVDDEPTIRHLVEEVLHEHGYTIIGAADGAAGIKVLQSDATIDLLITDVGLPGGINGRQVADAARAVRPGLRVLFITGYAENAAIGNGHLEPGMALLTKPFTMDALASKVGDILGTSRTA